MRDSIFKLLLKRGANTSYFQYYKLLFLEAYLGEQLVEMLSTTSSFRERTSGSNFGGTALSGVKEELAYFIPATFINRCLKKEIIELLQEKYVGQYGLLREAPTYRGDIFVRYEVDPSRLFILVELKLAYNTIWVTCNLIVDIAVYLLTGNIVYALTAGGFIEFIRRFKW